MIILGKDQGWFRLDAATRQAQAAICRGKTGQGSYTVQVMQWSCIKGAYGIQAAQPLAGCTLPLSSDLFLLRYYRH